MSQQTHDVPEPVPERERRIVHAPADPQPQERPPEEGQPHVPHGDDHDDRRRATQ